MRFEIVDFVPKCISLRSMGVIRCLILLIAVETSSTQRALIAISDEY